MIRLFSLFAIVALAGCTAAQITTAETTAAQLCTDIGSIESAAGPLNLIPIVATTEGYLGDACAADKLASADLAFLSTFKTNLAATVAGVK